MASQYWLGLLHSLLWLMLCDFFLYLEAQDSKTNQLARVNKRTLLKPQLSNVSGTIEGLLEGYDIRLRPQFGGKRYVLCAVSLQFNVNYLLENIFSTLQQHAHAE